MSAEPRFAMVGAGGRMGRAIVGLSLEWQDDGGRRLLPGGALERAESEHLGRDVGLLAGAGELGVPVVADPAAALANAQVAIDFSSPASSLQVARACRERGAGLVVGTTGFTPEERRELEAAAQDIALVIAPNMALGVNLLFYLTDLAARALGQAYDAEVSEIHHHHKKDAPSGTAARLKEILIAALDRDEDDVVYGREGICGPRGRREIGVHALRGGDVVGDHTVFFFGEGERLELTHRASSRNTFAAGALRAALFASEARPGIYGMRDVLGLGA